MRNLTGGGNLIDVNVIISETHVSEKMKVADLGCGTTGFLLFLLSSIVGKKGKVYAVDILKPVLETINRRVRQENIDNINTVWSNLEVFNATKIESGSLDAVFLVNTLYQSQNRTEILRESIRMLKKRGKMVIVDWKNVSVPFGPPVEERVKIDILRNGAPKLGLKLEQEFTAGYYHDGLIFEKL